VLAAGAVVWRERAGRLEVLLVHRPRYGDWSFPKGKVEPYESLPAAAVREVQEETGLRVALGRPLPSAHYMVGESTPKSVRYWAAAGPSGAPPPPPHPDEVDQTRWVLVPEAERMLTRRADRTQLLAVVEAFEDGTLRTFPVGVLRHGHARPKSAWAHADAERPLVQAGRTQAAAVVETLAAYAPARVVSSPWRRCTETVQPFLSRHGGLLGTKLRTKDALSEDGHRRNRARTADLVRKLIAKRRPVVVCTHRPVLGTLLGALAGRAEVGRSGDLPAKDPFLAPGELLVAHVAHSSGRVVAVERHVARVV
jgi:8-oxo-dGTP pyrophosphatase MutT (NUDIX family)/phosphohistidine phosphatase SixA